MTTSSALVARSLETRCCIAGGGPAGMMLGFLLARAGVPVIVLEKHADFLRDFRGDTIHPSTLEVVHELGLLNDFLSRPHQKVRHLRGVIGDASFVIADFSLLSTRCPFIALMPQWDFLDFLVDHARRYAGFQLMMQAEATGLIKENGRVVGVKAKTQDGECEIRADLVVGADGRRSILREHAGLVSDDLGAPIDVLWMRFSRRQSDGGELMGRFAAGKMFVLIDRGEYWQCALVIPKGGFEEVRERGLDALRESIVSIAPDFRDRMHELRDWNDVKLLTVSVDRLQQWHKPGFLCIGDAAHAMSPVGGVGINLAIQDAVAAANILAEPLARRALTDDHLGAVQARRLFPTRATQWMQVLVQNRVLSRVLASRAPLSPPWPIRLLGRLKMLQRLPARLIGVGLRPEHVRTPDILNVPAR